MSVKGIGEPQHIPPPSLAAALSSVFLGRIAGAGAAFLGTVLVARHTGPGAFGQFAILFALMNVTAEFARSALDTSVVRFAARRGLSGEDALDYFRVTLRLKLWIAAVIVVLGITGARPLCTLLFGNDAAVPPHAVTLAFAGGAVLTFWGFAMAFFQARQQFTRYAIVDFLNSALRLLLIVMLTVLYPSGGMVAFLGVYVVAPAALTLAAWVKLPRGLLRAPPNARVLRNTLLGFAQWVLIASVFTSVAQRLDLFLLGYYRLPPDTIGHYGAALNLVLLGDLVILTLYNVLLPRASQISSVREMSRFLKSFQLPSILLGLAMIPLIPLAGVLVRWTFGPAYVETAGLFSILLVGTLVAMGCAPAGTAVYALGRPQVIAVLEGVKLLLVFAFGVWAVPRYGAAGMAWTVASARAIISVTTYMYVLGYMNKIRAQ